MERSSPAREADRSQLEELVAKLQEANQELRTQIGERERAEQELRQIKTLLEAVIVQSPIPMVLVSYPDLIIRVYNEACLEVLQSDQRWAIGKSLLEIKQDWQDVTLDGTARPIAEMPLGLALQGRRTEKLRSRVIRKDGSVRLIEASAAPIHAEDGRLIAGFIIFPDVTESQRAEDLLRAQHDLALALTGATSLEETLQICLRALLQIAPLDHGGIYLVDPRTGALELAVTEGLSPEFTAAVTRYPAGSEHAALVMAGRPVYLSRQELESLLPPRDREEVSTLAMLPVQHRGQVIAGINLGSRHQESVAPTARAALEAMASQIGNAIAHAIATDRLRQSEERYRNFVANASEGIHRIDFPRPIPIDLPDQELARRVEESAVIGEINEALAALFGLPRDQLLGQPAVRFAPDCGARAVQLVRAPGHRVSNHETTDLDREGRPLHFTENTTAIIEDGCLQRVWGTKWNITERRRAEVERRRLEEQLRQSQKMDAIGRLAGGIAHDFNNLLTGINGHAELLLGSLRQGDPLRADLEEIRRAGERAASLTHQLLAFSRKQVISPRVIDPNETIGRSQSLLRRIIGEDIELCFRPAEQVGRIKADPSQLDQILVNLAVNARDAMQGGGRLTVETANLRLDEGAVGAYPDARPGDFVRLTVEDNGCGMEEETAGRIFEPFFTTKGKEHTGLGLATVYGVIQQNHGFVSVRSTPGVGTSFEICFPRVFEEPEPITASAGLARGSETILLVEDEEVVRSLARRILERQGYHVIEAADGPAALLACSRQQGPIQLLLTDVVMPVMNGHELYQRLIALRPELKVLFMSGYTKDVVAVHGMLEPGIEFLQKPFTIQSLTERVREVLGRP